MKGTFISSDYVYDYDGNARLIEVNTDTGVISSSLHTDQFSTSDFIEVLDDNSITKVHIISKPLHKYLVDYISEELNASASFISEITYQLENNDTIYPEAVADESNKFILRLAYDESTILDSYYCKNKTRLLTLMADAGDQDYVPTFYATSSYADSNYEITSSYVNTNEDLPDFVYKASFGNRPVEFCTLVDTGESDEDRWTNTINEMKTKSILSGDGHIELFHYQESDLDDDRVTSIRSFDIIYTSGSTMTSIPFGRYKVQSVFDLPTNITISTSSYDGQSLNNYRRIDMKHIYEFGTKHMTNIESGVWSQMDFISGSVGYTYNSLTTGSAVESYYVNGVPDSDDVELYASWSVSGKQLPSGSYITSSIVESVERDNVLYKNLLEISLDNGDKLYGTDNLYVLAYDTSSDETSFQLLFDLTTNDYLHTTSGNLIHVSSSNYLITNNQPTVTKANVEAVDNFIVSGSEKIIVHNAPCFKAGTQIETRDSGRQNIEDIKVGDYVASFNHTTNEIEYKAVKQTLVKEDISVVKLTFDSGTELIATPDHPLYVKGVGYASVSPQQTKDDSGLDVLQLEEGNLIQNLENGDEKLISIEELSDKITVYNLSEVEDNKNFYAESLLVHNRYGCFHGDVNVQLSNGEQKQIKNIVVGDFVRVWDIENQEYTSGEVINLHNTTTLSDNLSKNESLGYTGMGYFVLNGVDVAKFTPTHPFLTKDGWKALSPNPKQEPFLTEQEPKVLEIGDFYLCEGDWVEIKAIDFHPVEEDETVYNIEVANYHSYIVDGIVVHNK